VRRDGEHAQVVRMSGFCENISENRAEGAASNPKSMLVLPVIHFVRPRTPIIAANVITKGCRRWRVMMAPLTAPIRAPRTSTAATAAAIWRPTEHAGAHLTRRIPASDAENARTLPTERSMPPAMTTSVIASAMMPISPCWRRMSVKLPADRKTMRPSAPRGLRTTPRMTTRMSPKKGRVYRRALPHIQLYLGLTARRPCRWPGA
jgi:hypothetical protein